MLRVERAACLTRWNKPRSASARTGAFDTALESLEIWTSCNIRSRQCGGLSPIHRPVPPVHVHLPFVGKAVRRTITQL